MSYPGTCCGQGKVSSPSPIPKGCPNCLFIPNFTYSEDPNAVPCGLSAPVATLDLKALPGAQLSVCTGTITWQVIDYDSSVFFSMSISNGVLSFQFAQGVDSTVSYDILVKAACDVPGLSVIACIGLIPYNACANSNCGEGEACDPCDGICKPINDIEVS